MTNIPTDKEMAPAMALALAANFGSVQRWRDEFTAMSKAQGAASRWVLLTFRPSEGTLVNQIADSDAGPPAGGIPILAVNMDGRAGAEGSGAAAGDRVAAFMRGIDWEAAYAAYQLAVHDASDPWGAGHDDVAGAVLLDVRRAGMFNQAASVIPGSSWHDPAEVASWSGELPRDQPVVVYCIYGHEVGRATAMRLRARGLDARFLAGGIDGWEKAGRPLQPR